MNTDVSLTDYDPQLALLQRQQKLAEMMQQQGQEPIQATTFNGIQAAASPYAALAKALQQYTGGMLSNRAFQKQQDLSSQARSEAASGAQNLFQKPYMPQEGDTGANVPMPTDVAGSVDVTPRVGSPIPKTGDEQLAAALQAVNSGNPYTRQLAQSVLPGIMQSRAQANEPYTLGPGQSRNVGNQTIASAPTLPDFSGATYEKPADDGTLHRFTKDVHSGKELDLGPAPPKKAVVNGQVIDLDKTPTGTVVPPQPDEFDKEAMAAYGSDYKNNPAYQAAAKRKLSGELSPEREAQELRIATAKNDLRINANQYNLTPQETDALNKGIQDGTIDPTKVTSRTAKIFASMKMADPTTDFVSASGVANLKKNPAVQQKIMAAKTIPTILGNLEEAGKKLNLSDAKVVGGFQNWVKGQVNDPNYTAYMTTRNDAILRIAYAMRGTGMSDEAAKLEQEVANPTMSPSALHAYVGAQMASLKPTLDQYAGIDARPGMPAGGLPVPGSPAAPGPAAPTQPAAPRIRVFNPATGKLE